MPASDEATAILPGLSPICGWTVEARFDSALMSSDGVLLILREIEQRLDIAQRLASCIHDPRAPGRTVHGLDEIIRFRMLMIAAGLEDGNDADSLRADPLFKLAMNRLPEHRDLAVRAKVLKTKVRLHLPQSTLNQPIFSFMLMRLPRMLTWATGQTPRIRPIPATPNAAVPEPT